MSVLAGRSLRPAGLHAPPGGHDTPSHPPPRRSSAHPTAVRRTARLAPRTHTQRPRTTTLKTTQGNMLRSLRNVLNAALTALTGHATHFHDSFSSLQIVDSESPGCSESPPLVADAVAVCIAPLATRFSAHRK